MNTRQFTTGMVLALLATFGQAQTGAPKLIVTLKPNPPITGDNVLDILISDSTGAPITGLKLISTVAMTNMNMGTAHPPVKELGKGHYKLTAGFLMDGPWRVALKGGQVARSFDFDAGSKKPWKMPAAPKNSAPPAVAQTPIAPSPPPPAPTVAVPAAPVVVASPPVAPQTPMKAPEASPPMAMPAMGEMSNMTVDGHEAMKMPQLKPTTAVTVSGDEDWPAQTGFGRNAPMVGMMIQMMVGGSGMENMKMGVMKMDFGDTNYARGATPPMDGMDPQGMKGMPGMAATPSSSVKATARLMGNAKVGDNQLEITVLDAAGKPVSGAKITLSVAMTSMDMGATHPVAKELGKGKYSATANFSMAGPWRIVAKVEIPGKPAITVLFDYQPKQ